MGDVHVALATDRRCLWGAAVSMQTIADHAALADTLNFHVFTSGLSRADEERLRRTAQSFGPKATLRLFEFDPRPVVHFLRSKLITHTAYASLFLDELVPADVKRCLYVDCDLIFNRNLLELWNVDLDGSTLGAVDNSYWDDPRIAQRRLGLDEPRYFNSGVLLVDLQRWRSLEVGKKALQFAEEMGDSLILHDQDALNRVLQGDWVSLPRHWNHWAAATDPFDPEEATVFHFMGWPKPWHADYPGPARLPFFNHLDRTGFAGSRPWNPVGLGSVLRQARRKTPFLPAAVRMVKQRVRSVRSTSLSD